MKSLRSSIDFGENTLDDPFASSLFFGGGGAEGAQRSEASGKNAFPHSHCIFFASGSDFDCIFFGGPRKNMRFTYFRIFPHVSVYFRLVT